MLFIKKLIQQFLIITLLLSPCISLAENSVSIPILCYHNFNPTAPGSTNITPKKFEEQMQWLKNNGYTIIPLQDAVAYLLGQRTSLPPKPVVVTADDGWQSVYKYMYPIVRKYNIPVTLFIYPAPISEGRHVLTWKELQELKQTGLFDIQSHTLWHPNFKHERKRLSAADYDKFVTTQLVNSKKELEEKLGIKVTTLAWPYGIYNDDLERAAAKAGYVMAFSIDDVGASKKHDVMAQPRFMIEPNESMHSFAAKMQLGSKTIEVK